MNNDVCVIGQLDHWVAKHGATPLVGRPRRSAFLHFYSKHLPEVELQASAGSLQPDSCRSKVSNQLGLCKSIPTMYKAEHGGVYLVREYPR